MTYRAGVRLGIDVGRARIGVARCDREGLLVVPVDTIARGKGDIAALVGLAAEYQAMEVVVGLPLSLSGAPTSSTDDARDFARALASATDLPVRLVDERLSTVAAQRALHEAGRNTRNSRPVIDQVAATIILQHALDAEKSGGNPPGTLILRTEG